MSEVDCEGSTSARRLRPAIFLLLNGDVLCRDLQGMAKWSFVTTVVRKKLQCLLQIFLKGIILYGPCFHNN